MSLNVYVCPKFHYFTEIPGLLNFLAYDKSLTIVELLITLFSKPMLQRLQSESVQINTK